VVPTEPPDARWPTLEHGDDFAGPSACINDRVGGLEPPSGPSRLNRRVPLRPCLHFTRCACPLV